MFFNDGDGRQLFLDKAELVDDQIWRDHVDDFIRRFVVQIKRDRWRHLLLDKPEKGKIECTRIFGDLITTFRSPADYEVIKSLAKRNAKGIYYDFSGKGWRLSSTDAFYAGHGYESIFWVQNSGICIYFWHEMEEFLFSKPKIESVR